MQIISKSFNGENVRCFVKDNEPYFSITDVCNILGLSNPSTSAKGLTKDYISTTYVIDSMKRTQEIIIINEFALYELIFKSRKSQANNFKKWVFEDVLPSIRKTGQYSIPNEIKKMSTEKRNILTEQWKEHGCNKRHHYINLTMQEYKTLSINKKKSEMNKKELLLLSALETMEALKLLDREDIKGYYECIESIRDTGNKIKLITESSKLMESK